MKKTIIILSSLVAVLLIAISCEEDKWPQNDIQLTPVYSVTDIVWADLDGDNSEDKDDPRALDIYLEKPLMTQFKTTSKRIVTAYELGGFEDNSTESSYSLSFRAYHDYVEGADVDTLGYSDYTISGVKGDSSGTMSVIENLDDVSVSYEADITIFDSEVYN